ncbi:hypothetical protein AAHE18_20G194100 [Arachis hypogaea]
MTNYYLSSKILDKQTMINRQVNTRGKSQHGACSGAGCGGDQEGRAEERRPTKTRLCVKLDCGLDSLIRVFFILDFNLDMDLDLDLNLFKWFGFENQIIKRIQFSLGFLY